MRINIVMVIGKIRGNWKPFKWYLFFNALLRWHQCFIISYGYLRKWLLNTIRIWFIMSYAIIVITLHTPLIHNCNFTYIRCNGIQYIFVITTLETTPKYKFNFRTHSDAWEEFHYHYVNVPRFHQTNFKFVTSKV